ncbi:hypothetical protein TNCV_1735101 [Trichonephila clavipes]|nr:hypothetical protein TNCV_1735101 [Trichonephila clavipes]
MKFDKMMTAFQTVLEKQTAFLMGTLHKSLETVLSHVCSIIDSTTRCSPPGRKKRASDTLNIPMGPVSGVSGIMENSSFADRINPNNSIFTAEALVVCKALDQGWADFSRLRSTSNFFKMSRSTQ